MRQPVLASFLRLGPPFALLISLLVRLAAVQSLSAGHSAPQQGPAPHFLTVSWKLRILKNPGIESGNTIGVIITWKTIEDDKNNLGMCSRRVNRDRARKREADSSHWCQPPNKRNYGGLPERVLICFVHRGQSQQGKCWGTSIVRCLLSSLSLQGPSALTSASSLCERPHRACPTLPPFLKQ